MFTIPRPQPEASPDPTPPLDPPPHKPAVPVPPRVTQQPVAPATPALPVASAPPLVSAEAEPAVPFGVAPSAIVSGLPHGPGGSSSSGGVPGRAPMHSSSHPPLAKLGDLSKKPRAPSLDARLRQNYPRELRQRGVEGQAEVRAVVNAAGRVEQVSVLSETAPGFALACKNTLLGSQWTQPLDRNGEPVGTRLTYRCRFQTER
jgi:periplasmic protein TonB